MLSIESACPFSAIPLLNTNMLLRTPVEALHKMIDAAEEAMEAVQERDELAAEINLDDEPDSANGACSKVSENMPDPA